MVKKKPKPTFNVSNSAKKVRIKSRWRKPRGIDNKKRIKRKDFGAHPKIGRKNKKEDRGKHPCGLREILVYNLSEITETIKGFAIRISGKVSKRNKQSIREKAKKLNIKTLN